MGWDGIYVLTVCQAVRLKYSAVQGKQNEACYPGVSDIGTDGLYLPAKSIVRLNMSGMTRGMPNMVKDINCLSQLKCWSQSRRRRQLSAVAVRLLLDCVLQ